MNRLLRSEQSLQPTASGDGCPQVTARGQLEQRSYVLVRAAAELNAGSALHRRADVRDRVQPSSACRNARSTAGSSTRSRRRRPSSPTIRCSTRKSRCKSIVVAIVRPGELHLDANEGRCTSGVWLRLPSSASFGRLRWLDGRDCVPEGAPRALVSGGRGGVCVKAAAEALLSMWRRRAEAPSADGCAGRSFLGAGQLVRRVAKTYGVQRVAPVGPTVAQCPDRVQRTT